MQTLQQRLFCVMMGSLSILGLASTQALADNSLEKPFNLQVSLLTPTTITLGEPILARYQIVNASSQKVGTHLGIYGTDWFTLTLQDTHGIAVPIVPDPRPVHPQGAYSSKSGFFLEGQSDTDYIPVTKRFVIQRPGQYTLILHAKLPYVMDDALTEGTSDALATDSELMQTQDITFSILVTAPDPIRLRETAEALRKASEDGLNGQLSRVNMEALFSMPEAQAAASWRTLALKPSMNNDLVASELAELRSATGVDILAEMADIPGLNCTPTSDRINRLYNTGTPALREHIKAVARKHGFEMPETAGTPYVPKDEEPLRGGTTF